MRTVLTIAGSDSGGGAGIQADLKTFAAHGVFGVSAISAITAQNTHGIGAVYALPPSIVIAQIEAVAADFVIAATKIGMLGTAETAVAVSEAIARLPLGPVVLDTVLFATDGTSLGADDVAAVLRSRLIPLATVVTANLSEAATLTSHEVASVDDMHAAARALVAMGARAAIVKGGHLDGDPVDVVFDGRCSTALTGRRVPSRSTHGTGCTFASAVAARVALGDSVSDAARAAKAYVADAIAQAPAVGRDDGRGHGPLQHFPE